MSRKFLNSITLIGGRVQAVSFDYLVASDLPAATMYSAINKGAVEIVAGAPLRIDGSGVGVLQADASAVGGDAIGVASSDAAAGAAISVQTEGVLTLPDWTAITGTATLLAKATYWLDTTAGKLTATPPNAVGNLSQVIGLALSPTDMDVTIGRPILL